MGLLSSDNAFELRLGSILTDFDRKVITELYQPIMGFLPASLYFTLWSKYERSISKKFASHDSILSTMQISVSDFEKARKKLEALGLLKTFYSTSDAFDKYSYIIYAPKSPKEFFADALFSGLLIKYVGNEEASKIAHSFESKQFEKNGIEITASFVEVFNPNYDEPCYFNGLCEIDTFKRDNGQVKTLFNMDELINQLNVDYGVETCVLGSLEKKEIERLATLYGIDELTMSNFVHECLNINGVKNKRLNKDLLNTYCQHYQSFNFKPKTQETYKINVNSLKDKFAKIEKLSSKDYLESRQNGCKACQSDLNIINDLSINYGFNPSIINAIICYTLEKCDNKLPKAFVEKIAPCIVRSNIKTGIECYKYLTNVKSVKEISASEAQDANEISDAEYEKLMKNWGNW
ncbi:MAG: DnaD domain protein [Bacilli bacterium]|nr:DnaD domain protein [Bacilli bacterium]